MLNYKNIAEIVTKLASTKASDSIPFGFAYLIILVINVDFPVNSVDFCLVPGLPLPSFFSQL